MTTEVGLLSRRVVFVLAVLVGAGAPGLAQTPTSTPDVQAVATPASAPRGVIFADVLRDTIGDFRRLPSTDTLTTLSLGAAIALVGHSADGGTSAGLSGASQLDGAFGPGEVLGGAAIQLAGAVTPYVLGRFTGNERLVEVGGQLLRAQILSQTITAGVKLAARRGRPDGTQYSFPSGHTTTSFASATVLQRNFGWKVGVPAYGLAAYVAASRIQEKRHFLSDVVFGAALGIAIGRTVTVGRGHARFAVEPAVTPGGAGVAVTWLGRR